MCQYFCFVRKQEVVTKKEKILKKKTLKDTSYALRFVNDMH